MCGKPKMVDKKVKRIYTIYEKYISNHESWTVDFSRIKKVKDVERIDELW